MLEIKTIIRVGYVTLAVMASTTVVASPAKPTKPSFSNPQALCRALPALPAGTWTRIMYGEWACSSDFYQFGPASPRIMIPSNIQYSIGGKTSHSAYNINLAFDVNNIASQTEGLLLMRRFVQILSRNTAFKFSIHDLNQIRRGEPFKKITRKSKIEFKIERSRIISYVLNIDSLAYLGRLPSVKKLADPLVEKCRDRIASDLGFRSNRLTTDGNPVTDKGYTSFLFIYKGPKHKARIFCKVWPSGKYRLNGSIDGDMPFRDLSSGTLPN